LRALYYFNKLVQRLKMDKDMIEPNSAIPQFIADYANMSYKEYEKYHALAVPTSATTNDVNVYATTFAKLDVKEFSTETITALRNALNYGDVVVKCGHCGQWGAVKTACKHCGAPVG